LIIKHNGEEIEVTKNQKEILDSGTATIITSPPCSIAVCQEEQ